MILYKHPNRFFLTKKMPSLWRVVRETPRVVVEFGYDKLFHDLPWALLALAIGAGGLLVAYIFIKIAECMTRSSSNKRFVYEDGRHKETTRKSWTSLVRLVAMCLAILSVVFGFWIAANTAGFNFWTVVLGYGILSLVGTYAFGSTLKNAGAFFLIALTDKIEEEWVLTIGEITGRVTAIHILWVEMVTIPDLENGKPEQEIQMPTWQLLDGVIFRNFELEKREHRRQRSAIPVRGRGLRSSSPFSTRKNA